MIPIHRWLGPLLMAAVPLLGCAESTDGTAGAVRPPPPPGALPEHAEPSPGTPVRAELLPESCEAKVQSLPEVEERLAQADRVTVTVESITPLSDEGWQALGLSAPGRTIDVNSGLLDAAEIGRLCDSAEVRQVELMPEMELHGEDPGPT